MNEAPTFEIAGAVLTPDRVEAFLRAYPEGTLLYYDHGGSDAVGDEGELLESVVLSDIGRMCVIEPSLGGSDVVTLMQAGRDAPFGLVARDARLEFADPETAGGLYDGADALFKHFTRHAGIKGAKASKLLHLKRPDVFPILDRWLLHAYAEPAAQARLSSGRLGPEGPPMFWAAIREDLIRNSASCLDLRRWLAEQDSRGTDRWSLLAGLTDLRLLDVLTWSMVRQQTST